MVITPNDLHNKDFSKNIFGYKADDVDDFLDRVGLEFERLLRDKADLERQLKTKNEQIAQYNELQSSLSNAIIVAQDSADRLRNNARKEAELIIAEAEREATRILDAATDKANEVIAEMDTVKKAGNIFRKKIQFLVEAQLDLIKSEQWDHVLSEDSMPVATPELDKLLEQRSERVRQSMEAIEEETTTAFERVAAAQTLASLEDVPNGAADQEVVVAHHQETPIVVVVDPTPESVVTEEVAREEDYPEAVVLDVPASAAAQQVSTDETDSLHEATAETQDAIVAKEADTDKRDIEEAATREEVRLLEEAEELVVNESVVHDEAEALNTALIDQEPVAEEEAISNLEEADFSETIAELDQADFQEALAELEEAIAADEADEMR